MKTKTMCKDAVYLLGADYNDLAVFKTYFKLTTGFELNSEQLRLFQEFCEDRKSLEELHLVSGRQTGMSTFIQVLCIFLIGHKEKNVMMIFPSWRSNRQLALFKERFNKLRVGLAGLSDLRMPIISASNIDEKMRGYNSDYMFLSNDGAVIDYSEEECAQLTLHRKIRNAKLITFGTDESYDS
jgi:hypothetical protein